MLFMRYIELIVSVRQSTLICLQVGIKARVFRDEHVWLMGALRPTKQGKMLEFFDEHVIHGSLNT